MPPEIETIERILFGETAYYAEWRLELRNAHERGAILSFFVGVPPKIAKFTGRINELNDLQAILLKSTTGRVAVRGMPGVGKTSLAVEYACRYRDFYDGIWWCPSETRLDLVSSLAGLAKELRATEANEANIERAAHTALRWLDKRHGKFLLVYDNVTSPEEIIDLLPASGAQTLITSRFCDWGEWATDVELDTLPLDDAIAFLQSRTDRSDKVGAKVLAEVLGGLPLALDHAAAYCKRMQMMFAVYAAKADALIAKMPRGGAYPRSVAATFDLAITEAAEQCPEVEVLTAFLAQCAPESVPMALLEGVTDDEVELTTAFDVLTDLSLVKHQPFEEGTSAITMHRLVQLVAANRARANGREREAREQIIKGLKRLYPRTAYRDPSSWLPCARLTPHLLALREVGVVQKVQSTALADLLNRAGLYFHGRAIFEKAGSLFLDALAIREKGLGPEHPDTAESLNNLALLLDDRGEHARALSLYERALAIREKGLGPEHPDTAESLSDLALSLHRQHQYSRAKLLHQRALTIRKKVLGRRHPSTATSLNNLGHLLSDLGNTCRAQLFYEKALTIREDKLGPEHPDTARSLNNLANLLRSQGRDLARARDLLERSYRICKTVLGTKHTNTNRARSNLADLLLTLGLPLEALPLATEALGEHEDVIGPQHAWTIDSARVKAKVLDALGRTEDAGAIRRRFANAQP